MKEYFVSIKDTFTGKLGVEVYIGYVEAGDVFILHGEKFDKCIEGSISTPSIYLPHPFLKYEGVGRQLVDGLIKAGYKNDIRIKKVFSKGKAPG